MFLIRRTAQFNEWFAFFYFHRKEVLQHEKRNQSGRSEVHIGKKSALREHRHNIMGIMLYNEQQNGSSELKIALKQQNKGMTNKTF